MDTDSDIFWDIVKFNDFLSFECSVARVNISKFIFPSNVAETSFNGFSDFGLDVIQKYLHIGVVRSTTATHPLKKNQIILLNLPKGISPSAYKEGVHFRDSKKVRTCIFSVPSDVYEACLVGSAPMHQILVATSVLTKVEHWKFIEYQIFSAYCKSFDTETIYNSLNGCHIDSQPSDQPWRMFLMFCNSSTTKKKLRKHLKVHNSQINQMMMIDGEYFEEDLDPFVAYRSNLVNLYQNNLDYQVTDVIKHGSVEANDEQHVSVNENMVPELHSDTREEEQDTKDEGGLNSSVKDDADDSEVELKCLDCGDQFEDGVQFYLHTKTHKNYREFVCKLCGVRFLKSSGLQRHVDAIHTGEKSFKCEICGRGFATNYSLQRHTKSHSASRDFPCTICNKDYNSKRNLLVHMRVHTGEKPFECDLCDKKFTSAQNLKLHQRHHYDLKLFICNYCGRPFSRNGTCRYHMKIQHENKKKVALKCYSCKKAFTCSEKLKLHAATHNKKRTIECRKCFKKFDVESQLREHHENVHSAEKPYKCDDCESRFSRTIDRDRHQIRHKGEPTVMCSFCGKGFFMKFDCQRHELLIHQEPIPKIIKV